SLVCPARHCDVSVPSADATPGPAVRPAARHQMHVHPTGGRGVGLPNVLDHDFDRDNGGTRSWLTLTPNSLDIASQSPAVFVPVEWKVVGPTAQSSPLTI